VSQKIIEPSVSSSLAQSCSLVRARNSKPMKAPTSAVCSGAAFYFERKMRMALYTRLRYRLRMHKTIEPTILYFGTPVALISTLNADGSSNLAPMSSAWWLGWSCMVGLGQMGQTSDNLIRTRECVINLPSEDLVTHVDRLALTTGKNPVPEKKRQWGYYYEPDKFGIAGLSQVASESVAPPRARVSDTNGGNRPGFPPFRQERERQRIRSTHPEAARR
jgi:flavin reductase (DIM6/NTAB) family NADH-FMN oxidoreductase RutF